MRYFDHNATSPLSAAAREAWLDANERFFGNASSPHRIGSRADRALEEARERVAHILGCPAGEIIFTSGATESNNSVFHHFGESAGEIWISAIEHPASLRPAMHYFKDRLRTIPVNRDGVVELDLGPAALVVVLAANNETGVIQPWEKVRDLCRERGIPFFCDAVQWIGKNPARGLGACDFVSASAHKFGGPKGVGFLKASKLRPLLFGGGQEWGTRPGTENVPGILAMVAAFEDREKSLVGIEERLKWRGEFEQALPNGCEIVGKSARRLWNTVSVLMPEADCRQRWVVKLDKLGFAVSTGSACASGQEKPSHVLTAMGYSASEAARMLRFSIGWETTREDWMALADAIRQLCQAPPSS